jgi:DNA-binding IclR family transcriptional regulator
MSKEPKSGLEAVDRFMNILNEFSIRNPELGVTELATKLGVSKSTVSRNLTALAAWDLVEQDPVSRKYRLGMKLFQLGNLVDRVMLLQHRAHPIMQNLADSVEEAVSLIVKRGNFGVVIHQAQSRRWVNLSLPDGGSLPLHAGSASKTLLAFCPLDEQESYLELSSLEKYTSNTLVKPAEIRSELEKIRSAGYAISNGEVNYGFTSISVPVWDNSYKLLAALSIIWPSSRIKEDRWPEILDQIKKASLDISIAMGYEPEYQNKNQPGSDSTSARSFVGED